MSMSYANSGGSGDRSALITVTSTVPSIFGDANQLINGTYANEYVFDNDSLYGGKYI
jgi:hypothetical protein